MTMAAERAGVEANRQRIRAPRSRSFHRYLAFLIDSFLRIRVCGDMPMRSARSKQYVSTFLSSLRTRGSPALSSHWKHSSNSAASSSRALREVLLTVELSPIAFVNESR